MRIQNENADIAGFMVAIEKIPEINAKIGLRRASGMERIHYETVGFFCQMVVSECDIMSKHLHNGDLRRFAISMHSMKGALASIGAETLSHSAQALVNAAKNNESDTCDELFPDLRENLISLHRKLSVIFNDDKAGSKAESPPDLQKSIRKALKAADMYDYDTGVNVLEGLIGFDFGSEINNALEAALSAFNDYSFKEAKEILLIARSILEQT